MPSVVWTYPHLALDEMLRGYHKVYSTCHRFQCAVLKLFDLIRFDVMRRHLQKEMSLSKTNETNRNGSGSSIASTRKDSKSICKYSSKASASFG